MFLEEKVILTKNSPIIKHSKEATQANKEGKEFYISQEDLDEALQDSIEFPYSQKPIPTNRFGEDPITVFGFGEFAKKYGEFLKDATINEMPIVLVGKYYVDKQSQFARKVWFWNLDGGSFLGGDGRFLRGSYGLRGVRGEDALAN